MKKVMLFAMLAVICGIALNGVGAASDSQYAAETEAYKGAVNAWAESVAVSRANALHVYNGVQIVVNKVEWVNYPGPKAILHLAAVNTSNISVKIDRPHVEWRDAAGRRLESFSMTSVALQLGPGETKSLSYGEKFKKGSPATQGMASVRFNFGIWVDEPDTSGMLKATGKPFALSRPRDPFWLSEKEIDMIVGSAEMRAGVYDQRVQFPDRGWWPISGENGSWCGQAPGPIAQAPGQLGVDQAEDKSLTEQAADATETAGQAVETVGEIKDVVGRVLDLF